MLSKIVARDCSGTDLADEPYDELAGTIPHPARVRVLRRRLVKNIPERVTEVAAGIGEDIQTRGRVNTFFENF
jgi:hypothetical protein